MTRLMPPEWLADQMAANEIEQLALRIAAATHDAHSANAWGAILWVSASHMLLSMDFSEKHTESILRSKLTRWARDGWGTNSTYLGQPAVLCKENRAKIEAGHYD